mmetsp:Transcript_60386/g.99897  ORF Transcript_60386/g.99897 Transcript_60386/m.99897 type:complete len:140 (+) Transcript_60386:1365-1784(+)
MTRRMLHVQRIGGLGPPKGARDEVATAMLEHSTACSSIAQHSTVHHSTAQHSTVSCDSATHQAQTIWQCSILSLPFGYNQNICAFTLCVAYHNHARLLFPCGRQRSPFVLGAAHTCMNAGLIHSALLPFFKFPSPQAPM